MAHLTMGEASRRIDDYLAAFAQAVEAQDGTFLASLVSISSPASNVLSRAAVAVAVAGDSAARIVSQNRTLSPLADLVLPLLRAAHAHEMSRFVDAYSTFEKASNAFLQEFRNWETAWALQAMCAVALEVRLLAEKADRELALSGKTPEKLQGAGSFLMKVFGALAVKGPKRIGALYVTCQLFKIYFKLGTVHLCRSVIRSIEAPRIFEFEDFPAKDKVTYMYYAGRLDVFNENFLAADQKLMYALTRCNPQSELNLRGILKFLIPVKLSLGILPKIWLLEKYHLLEYADIVNALRRGDLRLLRLALEEHEDQFLKSGVYLVLEKLELQVYQRLVKKIYIIQKEKDPAKAHQIKLDLVVRALKWLEFDMDIDEVECIMACLIYKNLVKGYFAHKSKVLVLSKQDPFPKLNGKPVST